MADVANVVDGGATPVAHDTLRNPSLPSAHAADVVINEDDNSATDLFLDVVVTSVDVAPPSVTQSITSSLYTSDLHVYTVEFVVTKGTTSYCIERPLNALFDVLNAIQAAAPKPRDHTNEPPALPEFPPKGSRNDSVIAQWCAQMTTFLASHRCGMLELHPDWLSFVVERDEDKGARMHMTAVDFILQPFPLEKFFVPRGSRHEVVMQVKAKKGDEFPQFIVWKFELEDFDVDFSVTFAPEPYEQPVEIVHARTRYVSTTTGRAVQGLYRCLRPGKATLVWDNSYSRLRGKNVLYQVQVVTSSIMESAMAAADALDEAVQAEKARDQERDEALSTALIVSPGSPSDANQQAGYSAYIPEAIAQQSWLLSAPINAAGHLAWKLFGSQEETAVVPSSRTQRSGGSDNEARSLLEELNGLNMQLMERMESLEDSVARLTTERDQERSKTHMAIVEKENVANEVKAREQELASIAGELLRIQREREAWREIQAERDALLEEKHRWAMTDDFDGGDEETSSLASEMDSATRNRLEQELGQAEAAVLRCRAELGYPLNNHLTGTSTRLEKIAREMAATKQQYEEQMQTWEQERLQLTQQLVKARGQRRVLVTEIRNMPSEARMVNKRLKKQNELLLTQIRSLINEAEENEKKLQEVRDELKQQQKPQQTGGFEVQSGDIKNGTEAVVMLDLSVRNEPPNSDNLHNDASPSEASRDETTEEDEDSPVPYTLREDDIAVLNGRPPASASMRPAYVSSPERHEEAQALSFPRQHRPSLMTIRTDRDPDKLAEVDEMLASYQGVEDFMELNKRIAQVM
ncbi:GOLD domain [Phytophthora cactorum]|nr:GOLD domain [Phytophthora cactorum]